MGGDANQVDDGRNRRAIIFLPINPLKMAKINTSRFDVSKYFGDRIDLKYTRSILLQRAGDRIVTGFSRSEFMLELITCTHYSI